MKMGDQEAVSVQLGVEAALRAAAEFDAMLDQAEMEVYGRQHGLPVGDRTLAFGEAFRDGPYPIERLPGAVMRAIDVKLQSHYLSVVAGMYNHHYFDAVNQDARRADAVSMKLRIRSIQQDQIVKSRILWERIMSWVNFIETGAKTLPRTGKGSVKAPFFKLCGLCPQWRWLLAYETSIEAYDDRFRTPEVHNLSTLRASLMRDLDPTLILNDLGSLHNLAMNSVWANVHSIVGGGGVVSLSGVHFTRTEAGDYDHSVDPFEKWGWPGPPLKPDANG